MIQKKYLLLFVTFTLAASLHAQTRINSTNSLLWEVSGNGLQQPSYIFGSYHLVGKDFTDTLPGIIACYTKTTAVAGEVLIDDIQAVNLKMMPYMLLKNNTLDKVLTPMEYAEVDSYLQKVSQLKLAQLSMFKPAVVMVTLATLISKSNVTAENPGIDIYFQDLGRKDKKKVVGLETAESQAELLFNTPESRQRDQLLKMVRQPDKNKIENEQMQLNYKTQNLAAFEKSFTEVEDYTPAEMDALLLNRNKNWMSQLPALMKQDPTFIIVGAGHLLGKDGLLNLLRTAGYTVNAISAK